MNAKGPIAAGVLAAIGASACCVAPLVLLALGIGGAWIGNLMALEPYRPVFIVLTLVFLGLAYRRLYRDPIVCAPDADCADPGVLKRQRSVYWLVTFLALGLVAVPWVVPLFF